MTSNPIDNLSHCQILKTMGVPNGLLKLIAQSILFPIIDKVLQSRAGCVLNRAFSNNKLTVFYNKFGKRPGGAFDKLSSGSARKIKKGDGNSSLGFMNDFVIDTNLM